MTVLLLSISLLITGSVDYTLKYAADHQMFWLAMLASLMWIPAAAIWYKLFQLDKYLVLSAYYLFSSMMKDLSISQVFIAERLTRQEILGCVLMFIGVVMLATKGGAR